MTIKKSKEKNPEKGGKSAVLKHLSSVVKRREKEYLDDLLRLIPSKGGIKLKEAAKELNSNQKIVKTLAEELEEKKLIRIKKNFLRDEELIAAPLLIEKREGEKVKKRVVSKKEKDVTEISTPADLLLKLVKEKRKVSITEASKALKLDEKETERWANNMSKFVSIKRSTGFLVKPIIELKEISDKEKPPLNAPEGEPLESYEISADKVPARVKIFSPREEAIPVYWVKLPQIGTATLEILNSIKENLNSRIKIQTDKITDQKQISEFKRKFFSEARELIKKELSSLHSEEIDLLAGTVLHDAYGLGYLELLLSDDYLEEICANYPHAPLTVYHLKYGWMKTNLWLENQKQIYVSVLQVGKKDGPSVENLKPLMNFTTLNGDKVCTCLSPISPFGNAFTIRKFTRNPLTVTHLISPQQYTLTKKICAFLWLCFQYELNVMIAGGIASGKTSLLTSLSSLIQPTQRIVSIEDTREIDLPPSLSWNWVPLTTQEPNLEGQEEISISDLINTSLKMRPDRIIVGEVRKREEVKALFEAMNSGYPIYSTIHAPTAGVLKRRLLESPLDISPAEAEALHLIIVQRRDRNTGRRRTFELVEVIPGARGKDFELNYLFRMDTRTHRLTKINESTRIIEELNLRTGMSKEEIEENLKEKEMVLEWMLKKGISPIDQVGEVMARYYTNPQVLLKEIDKDMKKKSKVQKKASQVRGKPSPQRRKKRKP